MRWMLSKCTHGQFHFNMAYKNSINIYNTLAFAYVYVYKIVLFYLLSV